MECSHPDVYCDLSKALHLILLNRKEKSFFFFFYGVSLGTVAAYLTISGLNYHNRGSGCWGINQVEEAQICLNSFNFFCSHHLPQWDCYSDNSRRSKRNLHGISPHKMYWSWHVWSNYQKEGLWADQASRGWQMSLHISASYFYLYIG